MNADLIGFSFTDEDGMTYTVLGNWDVSANYVLCSVGPGDTVIRTASSVRRRKELDSGKN